MTTVFDFEQNKTYGNSFHKIFAVAHIFGQLEWLHLQRCQHYVKWQHLSQIADNL